MALIPPIILVDSSGQQWIISCDNNAILSAIPVSGQPGAVPYLYLNDVSAGASWQLGVTTVGVLQTTNTVQGSYPTQALITAPNGTIYCIQVATVGPPQLGSPANGILQTALPSAPFGCNTPFSNLAPIVLERLEDPSSIFWNTAFEINTYLAEAENDLLMLIGRPTQTVATPFNLTPNTPWQRTPSGVFLIADIIGPQSQLRKVNLYDMDFNQSSWGSDWESDTSSSGPVRWGNIGFNWFFVHPAPTAPQTVLLDAIQYPVPVSGYPYTGSTYVPFHDETFQWLEMYAAHMCRMKEGSQDFQESLSLYKGYLEGAKRLSELEDKRDPLIFSPAFGPPAGVNSLTRR